jgi:hypothetical protein
VFALNGDERSLADVRGIVDIPWIRPVPQATQFSFSKEEITRVEISKVLGDRTQSTVTPSTVTPSTITTPIPGDSGIQSPMDVFTSSSQFQAKRLCESEHQEEQAWDGSNVQSTLI